MNSKTAVSIILILCLMLIVVVFVVGIEVGRASKPAVVLYS